MNTLNEMEVKSVIEGKDKITVVTTGAKYIFDKSGKNGKISCYQLLNKERLIATVKFSCSFPTLSVERKDNSTCVLLHQAHIYHSEEACSCLRLQINSDSLLDISCHGKLNLTFEGNFLPDYSVEKKGNILLIDEIGGIGAYAYRGLEDMELNNFTCKEWKVDYKLDRYCQFFVSVFPPRKFNYSQSFEDRIAHHGSLGNWDPPPYPYPSDKEIEEASKYANILVLHEMIWQGRLARKGIPVKTLKDNYIDASFCCCEYIPVDEKELIRVIKKAHSLKMRVIPYMSPFYSSARGKDFLDRVKDRLEKYDFDGVYFDEISRGDLVYSYQIIRETRMLLKDKILYYHCTADPLNSYNIYCPFINTYADYVLRAEITSTVDAKETIDDKYLRYVISGYNISNTINYVCTHSYPVDLVRKLVDKVLAVKARMYLGLGSPEIESEELIKKEYFPKLEKRRGSVR